MLNIVMVAIGGSIGSVMRYVVSTWAAEKMGTNFPYGTLIVNVAGCFIIGIFMTVITERILISPYWKMLVTVGFVGGLTTFSSFSYETFKLLMDSDVTVALYNLMANLGFGFIATWVGIIVARLF